MQNFWSDCPMPSSKICKQKSAEKRNPEVKWRCRSICRRRHVVLPKKTPTHCWLVITNCFFVKFSITNILSNFTRFCERFWENWDWIYDKRHETNREIVICNFFVHNCGISKENFRESKTWFAIQRLNANTHEK